ncbi:MBL fold metallo-hydrolase [Compostibacter hankyongensis]|uniref:MBL fold metallo-hydrolase n=1 Tax=Compostibacter hankyongensis TaxID=1007089 RepID=A0ABP8FKM7_9BACT
MKIAFHGAARTVTGSKHLLTLKNGKKILLDCGMFQGLGDDTAPLNKEFGFEPAEIDCLVLSHAHIDHSGLIPKLVKEGFEGPIYCTPATHDLTRILLFDSAEIQESDARFLNKRLSREGRPSVAPLYREADVQRALSLIREVDYQHPFSIMDGVELLFTDAGHIIGSAAVHLKIQEEGKEVRLSFSGDVGRYKDIILRSPETFPQADFILLESTYGNSLHPAPQPAREALLQHIIETCVERKGKLIIPAFSVGRTQELLYDLNRLQLEGKLPRIPFYVDSPLSMEATEVVKRHPECFNKTVAKLLEIDDDPFSFPGLRYIKSVDESKALNYHKDPCVILSASGMAEAGRVKHHIANNIDDPRNTILIVGYCEPHSLGGRLMRGAQEVTIYGERYSVNANVGVIRSMSAHGDYEDLCQFLACQDPRAVQRLFLVHGEYEVQQDFRDRLIKKGFTDVVIPEQHQEFGLG